MSDVSVRYMISDVAAAVEFYTGLLGFTVQHDASPAFVAGFATRHPGILDLTWRRHES